MEPFIINGKEGKYKSYNTKGGPVRISLSSLADTQPSTAPLGAMPITRSRNGGCSTTFRLDNGSKSSPPKVACAKPLQIRVDQKLTKATPTITEQPVLSKSALFVKYITQAPETKIENKRVHAMTVPRHVHSNSVPVTLSSAVPSATSCNSPSLSDQVPIIPSDNGQTNGEEDLGDALASDDSEIVLPVPWTSGQYH